jgi:hypothetical protein
MCKEVLVMVMVEGVSVYPTCEGETGVRCM